MELHIFMTCEEFVDLLNQVATKACCSILVTTSRETPYKALTTIDIRRVLDSRNIELGFLPESDKLLRKPAKDIYREDRIGLVSVHSGCDTKDQTLLLETTFTADPSASAKKIFAALRKSVASMANAGVKVINEKSGATSTSKSMWWTTGAAGGGKKWKQAENSWVTFEPLEDKKPGK